MGGRRENVRDVDVCVAARTRTLWTQPMCSAQTCAMHSELKNLTGRGYVRLVVLRTDTERLAYHECAEACRLEGAEPGSSSQVLPL